jgi:hypothetical protein
MRATDQSLFQPQRRLIDEAQVNVGCRIERDRQEAELVQRREVLRQGRDVRARRGIVIEVLLVERPAGELLLRQIGEARQMRIASPRLAGSRNQRNAIR